MTYTCKQKCHKHRIDPRNGFYKQGYKRCSVCQYYTKWTGIFCPCCGTRLAVRARDTKSRKKIEVFRY